MESHYKLTYLFRFLVYFSFIFAQIYMSYAKTAKANVVTVFKHLSNVNDIFGHAVEISEACEWLDKKMLHIESPYQHDEVEEKLDSMNFKFDTIRSDISFLETELTSKLEQMDKIKDLNSKMNELGKKIFKIDFLYKQLLIEVDPKTKHEDNITKDFIKDITNSANGITWLLTEINSLLLTAHDKRYILKFLANRSVISKLICDNKQSSHQMIHNLYKRIVLSEIKGFVMLKWAFGRLSKESKKNTTHVEEAKNGLIERLTVTLEEVKSQMKKTSRDVYECDPNKSNEELWSNGKNYATFGNFLQTYVMHTTEGNEGHHCYSCDTYKAVKPGCLTDLCDYSFSDYACVGTARECTATHKKLSICKSNRHNRRYEYMVTGEQEVLGRQISCPNEIFEAKSKLEFIKTCHYCVCTCETRYNGTRYFDTRNVTSDIENNKVITGAQLVIKRGAFYIKIWQGKLEAMGYVNISKTHEKNISELSLPDHRDWSWGNQMEPVYSREGHDYYYLKWENRTFCLDDVQAPPNHVLTGLKFQAEKDHIKLAIHVTPFEFTTGALKKNKSRWISNKVPPESRTEFKLTNVDVPIFSYDNILDSKPKQYIKLNTTGLKQDVGQNVVPFVDIQKVSSDSSEPFAGAGLMHKGPSGKKFGGFLALKLITYNFQPHLVLRDNMMSKIKV